MLKKYFRKIVDAIFGKRCECLITKAYTTVTTKKTIQDNKPVKRRDTILGKPGINKMDTSEVDLDYTAPSTTKYRNMDMGLGPFAAKDGGRAKHKSGGKVRGCGIAKRGLGRAMKKGKR